MPNSPIVKRCPRKYHVNKARTKCIRVRGRSPSPVRIQRSGKRCLPGYKYNRSTSLCVRKKGRSPSPQRMARAGKKCPRHFSYNRARGMCQRRSPSPRRSSPRRSPRMHKYFSSGPMRWTTVKQDTPSDSPYF